MALNDLIEKAKRDSGWFDEQLQKHDLARPHIADLTRSVVRGKIKPEELSKKQIAHLHQVLSPGARGVTSFDSHGSGKPHGRIGEDGRFLHKDYSSKFGIK